MSVVTAKRSGRPRSARGVLIGVIAWLVGLTFAAPVLWMVLTSFHHEEDAAKTRPALAAELTVEGYQTFFGADGGRSPWPALINSFSASTISVIVVLALAFPAAYALSIRPVSRWSDVLFFFLSTKFLPIVSGILALYLFARYVGVLDHIFFLILLYTTMNMPLAVWMLRSFLAEVPTEIIEAAQIDGANLRTTLRRVIAPVAMPGIAATALICFIFSWQELLLARTLTNIVAGTAPVFLTSFVNSQGLFLAKLCAAATVISIPVVAAGFAAQDKLVQGLSLGAVK